MCCHNAFFARSSLSQDQKFPSALTDVLFWSSCWVPVIQWDAISRTENSGVNTGYNKSHSSGDFCTINYKYLFFVVLRSLPPHWAEIPLILKLHLFSWYHEEKSWALKPDNICLYFMARRVANWCEHNTKKADTLETGQTLVGAGRFYAVLQLWGQEDWPACAEKSHPCPPFTEAISWCPNCGIILL